MSSIITCIVNGNAYKLSASDVQSIKKIPETDRQALVALWESIKLFDQASKKAVQQAVNSLNKPVNSAVNPMGETPSVNVEVKPERLGSGDIDAIMAKLVLEEKQNKKTGLTKKSIYKVAVVIMVIIFLWVLIF